MKRDTTLLILLCLMGLMGLAQDIGLPIEVFRIKTNDSPVVWDSTATRQITTGSFSGNNLWLYLQVNNLNDAASMRYRVKVGNGSYGNWQVCNPNWSEFPKDFAYGGLGGGFGTTEFTTPITGFQPNQDHTIEFEFSRVDDDETSGYRVINLELWANNNKNSTNLITNGRNYISGANFRGPFHNDPDRSNRAEQGRQLWLGNTGPKLRDRTGAEIEGKCFQCHAVNGSDLKYFNYSNKSIIARSNFHGLTKEEGEMIAQYIRDLDDDRSSNGRPWQPPYQPGAAADNNAFEWAAGQGLESVLDSDADMVEELFGSPSPSKVQIEMAVDSFNGTTNIRTMPISLQFPDWNEWLPKVHPIDAMKADSRFDNDPTLIDDIWTILDDAHTNLRADLQNVAALNVASPKMNAAYNGLVATFNEFARQVHIAYLETPQNGQNSFRDAVINDSIPASPVWANNDNNFGPIPAAREKIKRSFAHWYSVKLFETINEFGLSDLPLANIGDFQEKYHWPVRQWAVFQNAPHIIGGFRNLSYFITDDGDDEAERRGVYQSSIWYQVQLTLTSGWKRNGPVEPNDFAYNLQHIHRLGAKSGIYEPTRFFQNYLKNAEQRNNGSTPEESSNRFDDTYRGWNMRELSPWRLYSTGRGDRSTFLEYPDNLRIAAQEVFMGAAMDIIGGFAENEWRRVNRKRPRTDHELTPRDEIPINGLTDDDPECVFLGERGNCDDSIDADEIDAFYTLMELLRQDGEIDCSVFNKLRDWADARWDYTDWPTCNGTGGPTTYSLSVDNGTGDGNYEAGETITITATVPANQQFVQWNGDIQYLNDSSQATTQLTMPATNVNVNATFEPISGGGNTYTLTVVAGSGAGDYTAGETVTLVAGEFDGYEFNFWRTEPASFASNLGDTNSATTTFTMPNQDVTVLARHALVYELMVNGGSGSGSYRENATVNISADPPPNTEFIEWTGDIQYLDDADNPNATVTMPNTDIILSASYRDVAPILYTLDVVAGSGAGQYAAGEVITLVAGEFEGYEFNFWRTEPASFASNLGDTNSATTTFTMPDQDVRVLARHILVYDLTINGGSGTGSYRANTQVSISADIPTNQEFVEWTGDIQYLDDPNNPNAIVNMPNQAVSISAVVQNIDTTEYQLRVASGSGDGFYLSGTNVTIMADAIAGKEFVRWAGPEEHIADRYSSTTVVTMPALNVRYRAVYENIGTQLQVNSGLDLVVHPNPTSELLFIDMGSVTNQKVQLLLFDLGGKMVARKLTDIASGNQRLELDVSALPDNVYTLKIFANKEVFDSKVIIR